MIAVAGAKALEGRVWVAAASMALARRVVEAVIAAAMREQRDVEDTGTTARAMAAVSGMAVAARAMVAPAWAVGSEARSVFACACRGHAVVPRLA